MNRYIINLATLLLFSIASSVTMAEEDAVTALVETESANNQMPSDEQAAPVVDEGKSDTLTINATVDRAWGLLLGDELSVTVDTAAFVSGVNKTSTPAIDKRYGTWLHLKDIDIKDHKLVFKYQVTNIPNKNTRVETPSFDMKQNNGEWFTVPAVSITIGPALAASGGVSSLKLKADSAPTLIATDNMQSQLKQYAAIALISWLVLALWHFGWKTKNRQPFAQAVHDLSRLRWKRSASPDEASRILHTAFNQTSNTIVVYGEIDTLLENYSWLAPLQQDIHAFYEQSEQHFFARQAGQEPDLDMIKKLAKACRSKEMLA